MHTRTGGFGTKRIRGRSVGAVAAALAVGTGLAALAGAPAGASHARQVVITVEKSKTWGQILTLSNGDTLYRLTADSPGMSVCDGQCAQTWPPVLLATGQTRPVGQHVSGLGSIARSGGGRQVTYKGIPLYRFSEDTKAGAITGNVSDTWGQWWVVNPAHPTATPVPKSSSTGHSPTTVSGGGVAF
jgi:predicted lipoprotein with Yx(FWY)xxD motif